VHATVIRFRSNCCRANDGFFATEGSATYLFSGRDPSLYFFAIQFHQRSEERTLTAFDFESDMGEKIPNHGSCSRGSPDGAICNRAGTAHWSIWYGNAQSGRRGGGRDLQGLVPMSTSGFTRMLACAAGSVRGLCGGGQVAADSATLCLACMRHPIAAHRFPTDRLMAGPDAGTALSSSSAS
jgi:hypothetical protein